MEKWVLYTVVSMVFAGFTSVVAKLGLSGISGELGLFLRTCFVFFFVLIFAVFAVPKQDFNILTQNNIGWLALSGVTTAVSWIFYYKALKEGEVSTVALIDKGSFVVAVLLAWIILKEQLTLRIMLGGVLIMAGLFVVARK